MAVTLNKANLVLKDANGNIGKIEQLSARDLAKIKTAVSDVALVVNQSNHKPIEATTTNKGVVQLATSADVASGASNKVVTAEQLHNTTLATATANTLGVVKPDNDTITIDSNGVLTATKAIQDKNGAQIDTTYLPLSGGKMSGNITRNADNSTLAICGGTDALKGASLHLSGKDRADYSGEFHLVASNGTNDYRLKGAPNGTLIWNEKNIVRSVNGVNADTNGNVSITSVNHATNADSATKAIQDKNGAQIDTTYLPLSGGKMSGNITRNADNSTLSICGGTTAQKGATLHLSGKDRADYSGEFHLVASNGTNDYRLKGAPNGTLIWNEKNIVRSVNGVNADASGNVQLGNVGAITGEIKWFAFNKAPDGYLVCNGANVSRKTYANLFAVIGTTFGEGDGSTTFALPNLIDKFAQGSTTVGTVKNAGLPNITGGFYDLTSTIDTPTMGNADGAFFTNYTPEGNRVYSIYDTDISQSPYGNKDGIGFNASRSSAIYGKSTTVQPPALTLLPCIKY